MENDQVLNGRYQLLERVGSGGMATVYKAQDNALGRVVAIKILHESLTSDAAFLSRFQREAHAAANLTHPNLVTVHDIGQDGTTHYIVMEFVDGRTLKDIIRVYQSKGQFMSINRALDLTIQVCHGIGYAHRADLVHCDIKPQNILVTRDHRVKVADFGIVRAISEGTLPIDNDKQVWGTPQYFAPEQAEGKPTTAATDVYAIGIVLFELLSAQTPFQADTPTALALKHVQARPPLITQFNPAVPRHLELIVEKVLSKEPSGRYRTAGQLGRILSSYRTNSAAGTGPLQPVTVSTTTQRPDPVAEQKTQIFRRETVEPGTPIGKPSGNPVRQNTQPNHRPAQTVYVRPTQEQTDYLTITLGISALLLLIGLMPLWYFVYRAWVG